MKTIDSKTFEPGFMVSSCPGLRELAELVGVECEYVDGRDHSHQATDDTLRMILSALGIDVQSESDIQQEWKRIQEKRWTNIVEPVLVHYPEVRIPLSFPISLPLGDSSLESVLLECRIKDEQGKIRPSTVKGASCAGFEEAVIRSIRYVRIQVSLPGRLRLGYYQVMLTVRIGSRVLEAQTMVIAAPQRCYLPPGSKREWGLGVQLYGIRSRENWGIGDFRDLERIMKTVGKSWKYPGSPSPTAAFSA